MFLKTVCAWKLLWIYESLKFGILYPMNAKKIYSIQQKPFRSPRCYIIQNRLEIAEKVYQDIGTVYRNDILFFLRQKFSAFMIQLSWTFGRKDKEDDDLMMRIAKVVSVVKNNWKNKNIVRPQIKALIIVKFTKLKLW